MNVSDLKKRVADGKFDSEFVKIYKETYVAKHRFLGALDEFFKLYGDRDDVRLFSAPGRTEIAGNHTDHQHGTVIAGSINLDIIAVVSANNTGVVRIKSAGYPADEVDINRLDVIPRESGRSVSLIKGILAAFRNNGYNIGGFDAYTTSDVIKGSGLSSSAAFEILISSIINGIYNGGRVDPVSSAKYSQFAECKYFGKPCGLLDQMASASGGLIYADFYDPENPYTEKIDVDLSKSSYKLCVVDTGGNHADLTDDYADITVECKNVSNALGADFLRDVNVDEFYSGIAGIRKICGDRAVLRAIHIFNENKRVAAQKVALENEKFSDFLALVNKSGESSYDLLQNVYSPHNPKEQPISLALALTKQFLSGDGACRVHGGGFAGTIQCYVPEVLFGDYKKMIESVFGDGKCIELFVRKVGGYEFKGD